MRSPIILHTSLKDIQYTTLLLEIIDKKSIEYYRDLGFSSVLLDIFAKNLEKKEDIREKVMYFYESCFGSEKVVVFFPKANTLMDDRCTSMQKIDINLLYIPVGEFSDALEAYTLSTYTYDVFLSKKEKKNRGIFLPEKQKKKAEEQMILLTAITRARDLINLPPTDSRPEEIVKHIQSYPWKHFQITVIDQK